MNNRLPNFKFRRKRYDVWLSQIAQEEVRRKSRPLPPDEKFKILAFPNWKTFEIIGFGFSVSFLLSWVLSAYAPQLLLIKTENDLSNVYGVMWQVQAGIAAVALPILLFSIELSRDSRQAAVRTPEILIRETWIFPIILFALLGTVRMGFDISFFSTEPVFWTDLVLVFLVTVILAGFTYTSALVLLLNQGRMKRKALSVAREKMNMHLDTSLEIRVANNLLIRKLDDLGVEFRPLMMEESRDENYLFLKISSEGVLADVHLERLGQFIRNLPWKPSVEVADIKASDQKPTGRELLAEKSGRESIYWLIGYGDRVDGARRSIMCLAKSSFYGLDKTTLERKLEKVIKIGLRVESESEDMRLVLSYLRDNIIDAIRDNKTGMVKDGLEMYEELVTTFIDKLCDWGSQYDRKRASGEIEFFGGGWAEIRWIRDDLHQIIDASMATQNLHIIEDVLYFPIHLGSLAFKKGEYYTFNQFINWTPYYYSRALNLPEPIEKFVVDRCWRYLKEMTNYVIIPSINRSQDEKEIEKRKEFAEGIITVFSKLLKIAYDENQDNHFKNFVSALRSLFETYCRDHTEGKVEDINGRLRYPQLNEAQKARLQKKLVLEQKHASSATGLVREIEVLFFGLGAWMLHHYVIGKLNSSDFEEWNKNIQLAGDLEYRWRLFLDARKEETEHTYGWGWWESQEHTEGQVFSYAFDRYLQLHFCILGIKLIRDTAVNARDQISIPHLSEIRHLAESGDSSFQQILKQVVEDAGKWKPIIGQAGLDVIPIFKTILQKAVEIQKQDEIRYVINTALSEKKIELVKQEIIDAREQNGKLSQLVRKYGRYEYSDSVPEDLDSLGFNLLDLKEIYIENMRLASQGWGSHYGEALARGENERVLATIVESLRATNTNPISNQEILSRIDKCLEELRNAGCNPIILILDSWFSLLTIEKSGEFQYKVDNVADVEPKGYYKNIPVFDFYYRRDPLVVIIDIKKFGIWRQFKPKQFLPEEKYISKELTFCVKPFTEESVLELIKNDSKLRQDKEGKERPQEEVVRELLQKVHFRLLEQFRFDVTDGNAGYKVHVMNE